MGVQDMLRMIVAKADLILGHVLAWPWKRMALSLLLAWWTIKVVKVVIRDDNRSS